MIGILNTKLQFGIFPHLFSNTTAQGCECLIPWGTKFLHKSRNTSDFRTWSESIPKTRRNFGFDCSQVRNSDMFSELTSTKSESPTCFRNWLPSSPKFRRVFGIDSDQVRKHIGISEFRMQEVQIPNNFFFQTFFEKFKAIQALKQSSMIAVNSANTFYSFNYSWSYI